MAASIAYHRDRRRCGYYSRAISGHPAVVRRLNITSSFQRFLVSFSPFPLHSNV